MRGLILKVMPLVSVIIPNFNGRDLLRECLSSLGTQSYEKYEVIVVDNDSTDGSPEVVRKEFPWAILLETERSGIARACNIGLRASKGDIVVTMLNNDMTVDKDWLRHLVAALVPRGVGVVGGKIYNSGTRVIQAAGNRVDWNSGACHQIGVGQQDVGQFDNVREVDYLDVPTVRRDVLNAIGGIDEGYSFYYTDVDFCVRAREAGYKVLYVPSAVSWHPSKTTVGRATWRRYYSLQTDGMRFLIKHSPTQLVYYRICRRTIFVLITLARFLFKRRIDLVSIQTATFLMSLLGLRKAMNSRNRPYDRLGEFAFNKSN